MQMEAVCLLHEVRTSNPDGLVNRAPWTLGMSLKEVSFRH